MFVARHLEFRRRPTFQISYYFLTIQLSSRKKPFLWEIWNQRCLQTCLCNVKIFWIFYCLQDDVGKLSRHIISISKIQGKTTAIPSCMISADMYQNLWSLKYMIFGKKVLLVISDQLTRNKENRNFDRKRTNSFASL